MPTRLVLCLAVCLAVSWAAAEEGTIAITAETAQKPQSKLWYDQGTWWAALPREKGVVLWRYVDGKFEAQESPAPLKSTRAASECDVLLRGDTLFVLCYQRNPFRTVLHAFKFREGAYQEVAGYPATLPYAGRAATMTCDMDSKGTLWVGYVNESQKCVVHAFSPAAPGAGFSAPVVVGTTEGKFDIAAVKAFKGHVGVMWSDQKSERFLFRAHRDDKPADQWEPQEIALAGKDLVNDHLNLAADAQGNVWAITKAQTGPRRPAAPLILSRRSAAGAWSEVARIVAPGQDKTRPIVVLDAQKPFAYLLYTDRAAKPNVIRLTPVSLADGKPGREIVALKSAYDLNNATASKDMVTESTGLMIVAGAKDPKEGPAAFRLLNLKDIR